MGCVPPPGARAMCIVTVTVLSSGVAIHSIPHGKLHPDVRIHPISPQLNRGMHKINQQITPVSWALALLVRESHSSLRTTLLCLRVTMSWRRK